MPPEERTWQLHGTQLPVKFLEADRVRGRLVVSNRRVRLDSALANLEPGGIAEGAVVSVKEASDRTLACTRTRSQAPISPTRARTGPHAPARALSPRSAQ